MQQHYRINCGFKYLVLFHTQGLHSLELTCSLASLAAIELSCLPELLMELFQLHVKHNSISQLLTHHHRHLVCVHIILLMIIPKTRAFG